MKKVQISEVEAVAKLARIELNYEDLEKIGAEFSSILDFVETIQKADTDGMEPTSQVTGLNDVWREDVVVKSEVSPQELLAGAPDRMDDYVKVKKVL